MYLEVLRAKEMPGLYTSFSLLNRYGTLAIAFTLILVFGHRIEAMLWGEVFAVAAVLPFLLFFAAKGLKTSPARASKSDSRKILVWAWPVLLGSMAIWSLNLSDRYMLALFRTKTEVGLYSLAYQLSQKPTQILVTLFSRSMIPAVVNAWETRGKQEAEHSMRQITKMYLVLCIPAVAGLATLSMPLMSLVNAEAYLGGHRIV